MPQLWIPSDDLLEHDPIALQKIESPFEPPDLEAHGIKLFDIDDDANEAAACIVLASLDDDDSAADEPGEADDDDEIDDPADGEDVIGDL